MTAYDIESSPVSECSHSSKPRRPPSVTPRRFKRFFRPNTARDHPQASTLASRALRELTASHVNQCRESIVEEEYEDFPDIRPTKKRKNAQSLFGPDGRATPLPSDEIVPSSPLQPSPAPSAESMYSCPSPSSRSLFSVANHNETYRQLIHRSRALHLPTVTFRIQSADFHSRVEDIHAYAHPVAPYCVASCNSK